jgi:hypothetical protein
VPDCNVSAGAFSPRDIFDKVGNFAHHQFGGFGQFGSVQTASPISAQVDFVAEPLTPTFFQNPGLRL